MKQSKKRKRQIYDHSKNFLTLFSLLIKNLDKKDLLRSPKPHYQQDLIGIYRILHTQTS